MELIQDVQMALDQLRDEIQGVGDYARMCSMTSDDTLKKIFYTNMETERQHAKQLIMWLNKAIDEISTNPEAYAIKQK